MDFEQFNQFETETHALFTPEFAQDIAGMFGKNCSKLIDIYETSTEPKAYHGPTSEGVPAFQLSEWLCNQLGLKYIHFHGRGSQHRHCCEILRNHLKQ